MKMYLCLLTKQSRERERENNKISSTVVFHLLILGRLRLSYPAHNPVHPPVKIMRQLTTATTAHLLSTRLRCERNTAQQNRQLALSFISAHFSVFLTSVKNMLTIPTRVSMHCHTTRRFTKRTLHILKSL